MRYGEADRWLLLILEACLKALAASA
jgi:hypothetical protein